MKYFLPLSDDILSESRRGTIGSMAHCRLKSCMLMISEPSATEEAGCHVRTWITGIDLSLKSHSRNK